MGKLVSIMISHQVTTFSILLLPVLTAAFSLRPERQQRLSALDLANVGIFFGTSTGTTEVVGEIIKEEFGNDADGPFDVESLEGSVEDNFKKYDALIVGTPTWNTGADTERSGTHWDELYSNTLLDLKIGNKNFLDVEIKYPTLKTLLMRPESYTMSSKVWALKS